MASRINIIFIIIMPSSHHMGNDGRRWGLSDVFWERVIKLHGRTTPTIADANAANKSDCLFVTFLWSSALISAERREVGLTSHTGQHLLGMNWCLWAIHTKTRIQLDKDLRSIQVLLWAESVHRSISDWSQFAIQAFHIQIAFDLDRSQRSN